VPEEANGHVIIWQNHRAALCKQIGLPDVVT
jgi:hypothetical protein